MNLSLFAKAVYLFCLLLLLTALVMRVCFTGYSFFSLACVALAALLGITYTLHRLSHFFWRNLLLAAVGVGLVLLVISAIPMLRDRSKKEVSASPWCVVLGCHVNGTVPSLTLATRIDAAREYLQSHPEAKAVLSGGKGEDEGISEAECMYRRLVASGIAPERLIKEERSTSTRENLQFSHELIEQETPGETGFTLISSDTHLYRAGRIARECGLNPTLYGARTPKPLLRFSSGLRETVAIWYEWIF